MHPAWYDISPPIVLRPRPPPVVVYGPWSCRLACPDGTPSVRTEPMGTPISILQPPPGVPFTTTTGLDALSALRLKFSPVVLEIPLRGIRAPTGRGSNRPWSLATPPWAAPLLVGRRPCPPTIFRASSSHRCFSFSQMQELASKGQTRHATEATASSCLFVN